MIEKSFFLLLFFPILFLSISLSNGNGKNNSLNNSYETGTYSYIESGPITWYPNSNEYSVEFGLEVHENDNYDFYNLLKENNDFLEVYIKTGETTNFITNTNCINIPPSTEGLNSVVDYHFKIDLTVINRKEGDMYSIINSSVLSIDDSESPPSENIRTKEDLNATNTEFKTDVFNPYIVGKNGFEILDTSKNSVIFQLKIIGDDDNYQPPSSLDVTLNDQNGNSHQTTANYISKETEANTYIYEITEIEEGINLKSNSNYEIISLNNTGLGAVTPFEGTNDEIIIKDSYQNNGLGGDGAFTTEQSNPYIEDNGFEILEQSITESSVKFQINVINNDNNDFNPNNSLNVTLKDEEGNEFQTTANYRWTGSEENTYVYEIDELEAGKNYEIFSLNDTGLAVGSDILTIDEQIEIVNDLGSDGTFTTIYDNPYILEGGFYINDWTDTTVTYTIIVEDWEDSYKDIIDVRLNLEDIQETYQSKFIEKNNDEYTYEITGLNDETSYTFVSLLDTDLSVNDPLGDKDNEILLKEELNIEQDSLIFKTEKAKIPNYVWIILLIILIIIITIGIFILIRILHKNKDKKINHEINNLI